MNILTTKNKQVMLKWVLVILLILMSIVSLLVGVGDVSRTIILSSRIPRTLSLLIAGSTLAVSGLLMQQLTQNKFVSPTTAGTLASARLGVVLSIILLGSVRLIIQMGFAFITALVGTFIFTLFLRTIKKKNSIMVPLVGMMFGNIIGSIATFFALQFEIVQNTNSWLQGNFALISTNNFVLILIAVPAILCVFLFAQYFTMMNLGKDIVTELGISYHKYEFIGISLVSLATTAVLLTVGNISFIGVVIPNFVNLFWGDNFKNILPMTAILGSLFLIVCDLFARTIIFPYEIPVSVVVGVIGSFAFLYLLIRRAK